MPAIWLFSSVAPPRSARTIDAVGGAASRANSSRFGRLMWTRAERTWRRVPIERASSPSMARRRLMLAWNSLVAERPGLVQQLVAHRAADGLAFFGQAHPELERAIGRDHDRVAAAAQPVRHPERVQALRQAL